MAETQFEPIGGFPPIVREEDVKIGEKSLESRGFSTTNIVSINKIMDSKKKENLFIAFGSDEEDGIDEFVTGMIERTPNDYNEISFKDITKNRSK